MTSNHARRRAAILCAAIALLFTIHAGAVDSLCAFRFTTCPQSFNGDTILVPPNVLSMSSNVYACQTTDVIEGVTGSGSPPSVVFVIDHSYSMMGLGNTYPGNDVSGSRFNVTRDLIDTLYALYPDAEVGIVVFREVLFLDHRTQQQLVALTGNGDQSYLPLIKLNTRYGKVAGVDIVKQILETATRTERRTRDPQVDVDVVDLKLQPQFTTIGNTNINTAMDAAKAAMSGSSYAEENQFIVFLSDGEPYPTGDPAQHGGKDPFYFQEGNGMPTTFTVYFTDETRAPQSLVDMTNNIKVNDYSSTNARSNLWTIETNYDNLLSLLMENVIQTILVVTQGKPRSVTINGTTSTTYSDSAFIFPSRFALQDGVTPFTFAVAYTLTSSTGGASRDTTVTAGFYVRRVNGAVLPDGVEIVCWQPPALQFYYHGQPVSIITETMDTIEVRFSTGDGSIKSVNVVVTHTAGASQDSETLPLTSTQGVWNTSFVRQISSSPVPGDKKLQHWFPDSIVAIYRNPNNALDTSRIAVPFIVTKKLVINDAAYYDRNADGFIDSIFVGIDGGLARADLLPMMQLVTLPSQRRFVVTDTAVVDGGLAIVVREDGSRLPQTAVTEQDRLVLKSGILPGGGMVVADTMAIRDMVAPVINSAVILLSGSATGTDSLIVTFSESVAAVDDSRPFRFVRPGSGEYSLVLESLTPAGGVAHTFRITEITVVDEPAAGDSIWIGEIAHVRDVKDNRQANPANRRVALATRQAPFEIITRVINSPFKPGAVVENIPAVLLPMWNREGGGAIIMSEPVTPLKRTAALTGKVSIYDIVNNPVITDLEMVLDNSTNRLLLVWGGKNSKGRKVATGTYLAVVEVSEDGEVKDKKPLRIGVQR